MDQVSAVELRPRRRWLVVTGLAGVGVLAYAVWTGGASAWLGGAVGLIFIAGSGYSLIGNRPRIVLSAAGIEWREWKRRSLSWTEIDSMRELRWGGLLARPLRLLAIRTVQPTGARLTRMRYRADFTINISALEQPADAVLALVEQFSGREVERLD